MMSEIDKGLVFQSRKNGIYLNKSSLRKLNTYTKDSILLISLDRITYQVSSKTGKLIKKKK